METPPSERVARRPVTAVVPVKRLALAKSRLALADGPRRSLALAFALDTISALTRCERVAHVVVVTSEAAVASRVDRLGTQVVPEEGPGLGSALLVGTTAARRLHPLHDLLVVPGDLPCLCPDDVVAVLDQASDRPVGTFVPDLAGTGTTLLLCPHPLGPVMHYGPGSAARHRLAGLHALAGAPTATRLDVDTLADLRRAAALGLGPEASAAWAAVGPDDEVRAR